MLFEDISYLELWQPFCSVEWDHLCNFGRGCYGEQFCEIILDLGQWFNFLIWSSGGPPVRLCNFERGHQGKHSCEIM